MTIFELYSRFLSAGLLPVDKCISIEIDFKESTVKVYNLFLLDFYTDSNPNYWNRITTVMHNASLVRKVPLSTPSTSSSSSSISNSGIVTNTDPRFKFRFLKSLLSSGSRYTIDLSSISMAQFTMSNVLSLTYLI